ncbi:unnamed protein product [Dovyalis caffra]|uniref:Uncharacterized protein n=1 Tax=Dovyalis caffra TaxID=77055 RepID=A0AAV1S2K9_9ROSI|nr:unnamed protein product [Dovyalis caffra]
MKSMIFLFLMSLLLMANLSYATNRKMLAIEENSNNKLLGEIASKGNVKVAATENSADSDARGGEIDLHPGCSIMSVWDLPSCEVFIFEEAIQIIVVLEVRASTRQRWEPAIGVMVLKRTVGYNAFVMTTILHGSNPKALILFCHQSWRKNDSNLEDHFHGKKQKGKPVDPVAADQPPYLHDSANYLINPIPDCQSKLDFISITQNQLHLELIRAKRNSIATLGCGFSNT